MIKECMTGSLRLREYSDSCCTTELLLKFYAICLISPQFCERSFCLALQLAEVTVKVNKLSSIKTQLPYDYYSLDYCKPAEIVNSAENLGEVLRGDRIENSPYVVRNLLALFLVHILFSQCFQAS